MMRQVYKSLDEAVADMTELPRRELQSLSEENKIAITDRVVNSVFEKVKSIMEDDSTLKSILATKGDVRRVKDFDKVNDCVTFLSGLSDRGSRPMPYVGDLVLLRDTLIAKKQTFAACFAENVMEAEFFYASLVVTLYHTTSILILRGIDYLKGPRGDYQMVAKPIASGDIVTDNLASVAKNIRTGKFDEFLKAVVKKHSVNESVTVGVLALLAVMWVMWYIRDIVYVFLLFRNQVSDWFSSYATLIEMHALSIQKDQRGVAAKQMKIAKKFYSIADTFAVESDLATANAKKEIARDEASSKSTQLSPVSVDNGQASFV